MAIRVVVSVYSFIISDGPIDWNTSGTVRNMFQTKKQNGPFLSFIWFFERLIPLLTTIGCANGL